MSRVFIDTSAYFAFINNRETHHDEAHRIMLRLAQDGSDLFVTNFVISETHALLLRKIGHDVALAFLREVDKTRTHIIRIAQGDEKRARQIIETYSDKDFSLVDALSFAVMERLHIREAFSFDDHFAQYGFALLK